MALNIPTVRIAALASATSANGTARNGAAFAINGADPGALVVECTSAITTASVLATFKLQTSYDGTTYYDVTGATWASASGTGSAVTTRQTLSFDVSAWGHKWARVVATLSGASTASPDVTSATYSYATIGRLWGAVTAN